MVIGPGGTGSKMIANVMAHVLNIHEYGTWDSNGWCESDTHRVCHRSLPYGHYISRYPDIQKWIESYKNSHQLYFVLTTRDITISGLSRKRRFGHSDNKCLKDDEKARKIMTDVLQSGHPGMIWSYESFVFLQNAYLQQLYDFIDVESDFTPEIRDANAKLLAK